MVEHPILFTGEMVLAILEGRKTQTRRVITPQPIDIGNCHWVASGWAEYKTDEQNLRHCTCKEIKNRYGYPGDQLWVRESWQAMNLNGQWWHEVPRAERALHNWAWTNPVKPAYEDVPPRWLPSIHMPREACRIVVENRDVRTERVQDISDADAVAEGIEPLLAGPTYAQFEYKHLWDEINASRGYGWDVNPWVWVVEFTPLPAASPQIGVRDASQGGEVKE